MCATSASGNCSGGKEKRREQRRYQGSRVTWTSYGAWPGKAGPRRRPLRRDLKEVSNELSRQLRKSIPGTGKLKKEGSDVGAGLVSLSDSETGGQWMRERLWGWGQRRSGGQVREGLVNHRKDLGSYCGDIYGHCSQMPPRTKCFWWPSPYVWETTGLTKEMERQQNIMPRHWSLSWPTNTRNAPEKAGGDTATLPGAQGGAERRVVGNRQGQLPSISGLPFQTRGRTTPSRTVFSRPLLVRWGHVTSTGQWLWEELLGNSSLAAAAAKLPAGGHESRTGGLPGGSVVKNPPVSAGDARDLGSITGSWGSPGEGNDNPLQYSCLGNHMNRGAWSAIVHGVIAKSRMWLRDWALPSRAFFFALMVTGNVQDATAFSLWMTMM